ncbi:MAG TPA: hypothetical protein PL048_05870 [Leptospiraceae bacterium]|nr:hypothetical protein [Leptospiraceae bacterium]HMY66070.1 hypothetical protein [Leptospiraceae bacterium]HMZ58280.1 hypothetical protein [Leptospiraceae bacterium]HNF16455.1 hypothetical protein [Leptospiraceae bacterium]HNF27378.1 hypothetical protein [Leptospiraceae bacterium]
MLKPKSSINTTKKASEVCGRILKLNSKGNFSFSNSHIYGFRTTVIPKINGRDNEEFKQLERKIAFRGIIKKVDDLRIAELRGLVSKFKSRYEIAEDFKEIQINNSQKMSKQRVSSYSSLVRFFLTYSAYEGFCDLFFEKDTDLRAKQELYKLLESSTKQVNKLQKILDNDKKNIISEYLISEMESDDIAFRLMFFFNINLQAIQKINQQKATEYKNKTDQDKKNIPLPNEGDILLIPRAFRHKIAHGHLTASLTIYDAPKKEKTIGYGTMRKLFDAMSDLLFSIMDNKFNEIDQQIANQQTPTGP